MDKAKVADMLAQEAQDEIEYITELVDTTYNMNNVEVVARAIEDGALLPYLEKFQDAIISGDYLLLGQHFYDAIDNWCWKQAEKEASEQYDD